jgi:signal transduction histidine kinase
MDELLVILAHELRAPLASMLGRGELLLDEVYGPLDLAQRSAIDGIVKTGHYALGLINDLFDLSRLTTDAALSRSEVDVAVACTHSLDIVRHLAQPKQLRIVHSLAGNLPLISADERRITQILVNLLSNAVQFTPASGTVGLYAGYSAAVNMVRICVWDTGIGIAAADHQRIFQPFAQVERRAGGGVGLGLTLAQRLAELHGGRIALTSRIGAGSRFTVWLPVETPATAAS